jgi:hypothetical protein
LPLTLEDLQKELHNEFASLRQDLKTNFAVLNSRIDDLRTDFHMQIDFIRKDLREFYAVNRELERRVDNLGATGE